jgi:chromosome segregation ATPase
MQKINIKKVTKEQMLKMLEEAAEKQEAAEAEAAAHFKDGVKLAEENEKLRGEIGTLTEKLEENEKALEEVTAKYKSADHSAAMLRSRIDEAEKMRDQALEAHGEDMKALEKAKNESRELAKQLGEREIELAKVKQECESELAKQRAEAEKALMKMNAIINGLLKRLEAQRDISEDYHKSLKWCMAHPWRNVWRCMKEYFRF